MKIDLPLQDYQAIEKALLQGSCWQYRGGTLYGESVQIAHIAKTYGSPAYIYSRRMIEQNCQNYIQTLADLPVRVCYATKANDRIAIQKIIHKQGMGIDTVSAGEIKRALAAGFAPKDIVFSGVGKTQEDITFAVRERINRINVEAKEEIAHIAKSCKVYQRPIQIGFRLNPDVQAGGNDKIQTGRKYDKFGLDAQSILELFDYTAQFDLIQANGVSIHIGSQIDSIQAYEQAGRKIVELVRELTSRGHTISHIDLGGGFGIAYSTEQVFDINLLRQWIITLQHELEDVQSFDIEPGRSIIADAGILVTRINAVKQQGQLLVVDAGMHTLIRPSLYDSYHHIIPLSIPLSEPPADCEKEYSRKDIVGPICESGDRLGFGRWLPPLIAGDYLAILTAGAYGSVMANHYNARGLPSEILIDGENIHPIFYPQETLEKELLLSKKL